MNQQQSPQYPDEFDSAPQLTNTIWHNPSSRDVRLELYLGDGRAAKHGGNGKGFVYLTIPAGQERSVSSEYDEAIQTTRNGVVVGGLCPWLVKNGVEPRVDERLLKRSDEVRTAVDTAVADVTAQKSELEAKLEAERAERRALEKRLADLEAAMKASGAGAGSPPPAPAQPPAATATSQEPEAQKGGGKAKGEGKS